METLEQLKYIGCVIKETLRLNPPVPGGFRVALKTFELNVSALPILPPHPVHPAMVLGISCTEQWFTALDTVLPPVVMETDSPICSPLLMSPISVMTILLLQAQGLTHRFLGLHYFFFLNRVTRFPRGGMLFTASVTPMTWQTASLTRRSLIPTDLHRFIQRTPPGSVSFHLEEAFGAA